MPQSSTGERSFKVVVHQFWVKDAKPEQKGSFCCTASRHHYHNVNGLLALIEINSAERRGDDVLIVDRTPETEAYGLDERFNLFLGLYKEITGY